jgi:Tol biopolymer transport system component
MSTGTIFRRPAVLLALALCSVGGVVTLLGRLVKGPAMEQKRTTLSTEGGTKLYAAFSPDGQRLAYSGRSTGKDASFHIFVRAAGPDTPRQLTEGKGSDLSPAWSPDGSKLAYLRIEDERAQYLVMPVNGGGERKVAEFGAASDAEQPPPAVSWTPDGKSLVVVQTGDSETPALALVGAENGQVRRLTNPPEGSEGDSTPAVSPDGTMLAFVRATANGSGDIYLSDVAGGNPHQVTFDDRAIRGICWTSDSRDLVYGSDRARGWQLWRVPVFGGSPREFSIAGTRAQYPAVSLSGGRLIYSDSPSVSAIWRATLDKNGTIAEDRPLSGSAAREFWPMYSPDGSKIAYFSDSTGNDEIALSDADGGNRAQVTHMNGPRMSRLRWSPDGRMLLFDASVDRTPNLYTIAASPGGKLNRVATGAANGSWSSDGKVIYFQGRGQIAKVGANGGQPEVLVGQMGAAQPVASLDGKFVYYRRGRTIWRVPTAGGEGEQVIDPDRGLWWSTTLQVTRSGLYFLEFERSDRSFVVSFYDFATKRSSVVVRLPHMDSQAPSFSISPDGRTVLYPRVDQAQTDLVMFENFW